MVSRLTAPEQLMLLSEHIRHGIVMYDGDERIVLINSRVGDLFGFTDADVTVGSTLADYLACVGQKVGWSADRTAGVVDNHRIWSREGRFRRLDHHYDDGRIVEICFTPFDRSGAVLTFADVTHERTMQRLSERRDALTREASAMLERVASISAQHRLVALNAKIEAARLGDQGRGFAVVADEVRELSRQTSEVLREVGRVINASLSLT